MRLKGKKRMLFWKKHVVVVAAVAVVVVVVGDSGSIREAFFCPAKPSGR
jgi:anti-sigma-K factor RskA